MPNTTSSMQCLECQTEMRRARNADAEMLACGHCGSLWFPKGQIGPFFAGVVKKKITPPRGIFVRALDDTDFASTGKGFEEVCPLCERRAVVFGGFHSVAFQRCGHCQTLFMPRRTVDEVIAVLKEETAEQLSQNPPPKTTFIGFLEEVIGGLLGGLI
jgi:Zn-finger nucleic acid-binding protein